MAICLVVQPIHKAGYVVLDAAGIEVRHGTGVDGAAIARDALDVSVLLDVKEDEDEPVDVDDGDPLADPEEDPEGSVSLSESNRRTNPAL